MTLTRDQILNIVDLKTHEVDVPEWNGTVCVRALTGAERDTLERMLGSEKLTRAQLVALFAVDADGNRLFTEDDVAQLEAKHGMALERIVNAGFSFNRFTEASREDAKN